MEATKRACQATADYFADLAPEAFDPELMKLCADGLHEVAENYEEYLSTAKTSSSFLRELAEKVKHIATDEKKEAHLQHDNAFAIFEAMAVVLRETFLRTGASSLRPVQHAILSFFEGSGNWKANEGSLVSDYYYNRIPIAVLHSLSNRGNAEG